MVAQQVHEEPLLFVAAPPELIRESIAFGELAGSRGVRVWVGPVSTTSGGALNAASLEALRSTDLVVSLRPYGAEVDRDVEFQLSAARQLGTETVDAMVHRHGSGDKELLMTVGGGGAWMDIQEAATELAARARAVPRDVAPASVAAAPAPVAAAASSRNWTGPIVGLVGAGVATVALLLATTGSGDGETKPTEYSATTTTTSTPSVTEPIADDPAPPAAAPRPAEPAIVSTPPAERLPVETEVASRPEPQIEARPPEPQETRTAALEVRTPPAPPREQPSGGRTAQASEPADAVRRFYSALGRGDGRSAARYVVPGKRESGPLSGSALTRYYSSLREPLELVSVRPAGPNTVQAEYQYTVGSTRCRGRASIDVTRGPEGAVLIERIRTAGPC